ncbi:MAG: signal peptide peptidase SppA [Planctomycetota bacterium]
MDFANSNEPSQQFGTAPTPPAGKKGGGWKILWGIITGLSVLANFALFMVLIGVVVLFAAGKERKFTEEVIKEGPRTARIAIISVDGIIDDQQAQNVYWQLKTAREDRHIKGLIVRINSPGGTLSGSDQIYNEILKYRSEKDKPVVAFMQGVAASGGYYTSVACDMIVAEPTTITGSIGVIMGYLVVQQLLEDKLGIQPIVVKSGEKKDWPSSFKMPTDEQIQYMQQRIIDPAYKRFVEVVIDGRKELTEEDVNRLADGSIYWADQALEEKLIDEIGYLDDAIAKVKSMADIEKAQVIEYRRPFALSDILAAKAKAGLRIDRKTLYELAVPQVLYLWTGSR